MQRWGTIEALRERPGLDVVHASHSLGGFLAWMRERQRSAWPHLLLGELLPFQDAARDRAAVGALRAAGMRVLLLSALHPRVAARSLLRDGVDGVVSKRDDRRTLLHAVSDVLAGEKTVTAMARSTMAGGPRTPRFSPQEERVIALYAAGHPIAKVAELTGVKPDTARKYLARAKQKYTALGRPANSLLDLARMAWEDGLVH